MSKQDRQGARTVADMEQRYNFGKTFAELMGIATDARTMAEEAKNKADAATNKLTPQEVFNLLTNNGRDQGLYRGTDGQLYINASYIKSGEFLADLIKAGVLQSKDGQSFKLDLDNGIFALKDVMSVDANGAEIAGWGINKDYFGREEAGLNGSMAVNGVSAKNGAMSKMRFYAGANDSTERKYVTISGVVSNLGYFQANVQLNYMAADNLNFEVLSIMCTTSKGEVSLTTSDFDKTQPFEVIKTAANTLMAWGKITNETAFGCPMKVQISYDSCIPSYQVLDDGTLIAKYAKIGGYSIADLVARIEALEKR